MTHTYQSANHRYTVEPRTARSVTFYIATWYSPTLGRIRLTSLGTAANEGHGIPFFKDAVQGVYKHAHSIGIARPVEVA